jgi:hypothetical protein
MTEQAGCSSGQRPRFSDFVDEVRGLVDGVLPPEEVRQHFRNSRVEFWKGIRALVDVRIEHINRSGSKQKGSSFGVE